MGRERDALTFELPDGRLIRYDDDGPAGGYPILYFHGTPSSRLDFNMFGSESLAQRLGVRVVAVDRPGCGAVPPSNAPARQ